MLLANPFIDFSGVVAVGSGIALRSLRHGAATRMLAAGSDVVSVQQVLGDSAPSTTLNRYTHAVADLQAKAIVTIDSTLQAAHDRARPA